MTARKGFTLIELLVVIAVIGILAAIALISLTGLQRSARDSQRKSNISDYATALARFYQDQQSYPVSAAGGDNSTTPSGIFSGASVLVSGTYMPKVLMDPLQGAQGATNCKLSNAGAGQQCQYKYYLIYNSLLPVHQARCVYCNKNFEEERMVRIHPLRVSADKKVD